jgi:putative ABC transport system permease protein
VVTLIACIIVLILLAVFFKTRLGLAIRATGDNEEMVRSSSINAKVMKCIGLALGNACVALTGALICQHQMFSDVSFGSGMVVIGLACVIIGETIFGHRSVTIGLISAILGSIIYRIIIAVALKYNFFPAYALKLLSAVIVAIALAIPTISAGLKQNRIRREAKNHLR